MFLLRSYDFANIAVTLTTSLELFPRVLSFFSFGFFPICKPEVVIKLAIGRYLDFIIWIHILTRTKRKEGRAALFWCEVYRFMPRGSRNDVRRIICGGPYSGTFTAEDFTKWYITAVEFFSCGYFCFKKFKWVKANILLTHYNDS